MNYSILLQTIPIFLCSCVFLKAQISNNLIWEKTGSNYANFSPDSQYLIMKSDTSKTKNYAFYPAFRNVKTGEITANLIPEPPDSIAAVPFAIYSPDGKTIATAEYNGRIRIWDVAERKILRTINDSSRILNTNNTYLRPHDFKFSPDGKRITVSSYSLTEEFISRIFSWDVETGDLIWQYKTGYKAKLQYIFGTNNLYVQNYKTTLLEGKILNAETGAFVRLTNDTTKSYVGRLYSSDGKYYAQVNPYGMTVIYNTIDDQMLSYLPTQVKYLNEISLKTFSHNGEYLIFSHWTSGKYPLEIWHIPTRKKVHSYPGMDDRGDFNYVGISPNDKYLVTTQGEKSSLYGISWMTTSIEELKPLKSSFSLLINRENVEITFTLSKTSQIKLSVYNTEGKYVQVLKEGIFSEGINRLTWDSKNIPQGIYFIHLTSSDGQTETEKILLAR